MDDRNQKSTVEKLIKELIELAQGKTFIGIGGIPGSGKSSLAKIIQSKLPSKSIVIPMDGYHLFRKELNPEQMEFRGRRDTFNLKRFVDDIEDLHFLVKNEKKFIKGFPQFDHHIKDPQEGEIIVNEEFDIFIFEGLYILLEELQPKKLFDIQIWLESDLDSAMKRVALRNYEAGITETLKQSIERTDKSDKANAKFIIGNSVVDAKTRKIFLIK